MSDPIAEKIGRLLGLAERLSHALSADATALENGRPRELNIVQPEIQQLSAVYEKESASITETELRELPPDLKSKCALAMKRLSDLLGRIQRALSRIRHVSEGMIRAIADEVARRESLARPYAHPATAGAKRVSSAMLYSKVV